MLLEIFIFSIPEALAITWLAYSLLGANKSWRNILLVGVLTGAISAILRPVISIYFLNSLLYATLLTILLIMLNISAWWEALTSAALAMSIYLIIEFINITLLIALFEVDPAIFTDDLGKKFLCFLPQLLFTLLASYLICKNKISLFVNQNKEV